MTQTIMGLDGQPHDIQPGDPNYNSGFTAPAGSESYFAFLKDMQDQYPQLLPYVNKPGMGAVMEQAIAAAKGGAPWSTDRLQAAMQDTPYWKSSTEASRQWDVLSVTDPTEANKRLGDVSRRMQTIDQNLGYQFSTGDWQSLAQTAASQGLTDQQIKDQILAKMSGATGDVASNLTTIRGLANDYAIPISDDAALAKAKQISAGDMSTDDIKGGFAQQAESMYAQNNPNLAKALQQGFTTRTWADPYLQVASKELGVDPTTIDFSDPKWSKVLQGVNKDGTMQPMTIADAQQMFRTDSTYGYDATSQATSTAAQLSTQILGKFGAI